MVSEFAVSLRDAIQGPYRISSSFFIMVTLAHAALDQGQYIIVLTLEALPKKGSYINYYFTSSSYSIDVCKVFHQLLLYLFLVQLEDEDFKKVL